MVCCYEVRVNELKYHRKYEEDCKRNLQEANCRTVKEKLQISNRQTAKLYETHCRTVREKLQNHKKQTARDILQSFKRKPCKTVRDKLQNCKKQTAKL
jgi:hypothetical protein